MGSSLGKAHADVLQTAMKLTIAYITYRTEPHIEWFFHTLRAVIPHGIKPKVVVVDALRSKRETELDELIPDKLRDKCSEILVVPPHPSVWQGEHRKTLVDFHSCSVPRNTAAFHADIDGDIAYVDDLSVLGPQWFQAIIENYGNNEIICGSFEKVQGITMVDNQVASFMSLDGGTDYRWRIGNDNKDVPCDGRFLLGCTSLMPVSAIIKVNGWPELLTDGLGFEDCMMGNVLSNAGYRFKYSRRLFEWEDGNRHFNQQIFPRIDTGQAPLDKSNAVKRICNGISCFNQQFGGEKSNFITAMLRQKSGKPMTPPTAPTLEWSTRIPLVYFHHYESFPLKERPVITAYEQPDPDAL